MGIDDAARIVGAGGGIGKIPHGKSLANGLGVPEDAITLRRKGQQFSDEQGAKAGLMVAQLFDTATAKAKRGLELNDEKMILDSSQDLHKLGVVRMNLIGATGESMRAGALQAVFKESNTFVDMLLRQTGSELSPRETAQVMVKVRDSLDGGALAETLARSLQGKIPKVTWLTRLAAYIINWTFLSGFRTFATNGISTSATIAFSIPETAGSSIISIGRKFVSGQKFTIAEEMLPVWARAMGMFDGAPQAARLALHAAAEIGATFGGKGASPAGREAVATFGRHAKTEKLFELTGQTKLDAFINLPGRGMVASDAAMKAVAYTMETYELAARKGILSQAREVVLEAGQKGLEVGTDAYAREVIDRVKGMPMDFDAIAKKAAEYYTFTTPSTGFIKKVKDAANDNLFIKVFVAPFVQTPGNLILFGLERTPFGALLKPIRDALTNEFGPVKQNQAIARMALGSMMSGAAYYMATKG
ncbi:hypothetical protein LCGC14_2131290, partial [marine sediment metagenome]